MLIPKALKSSARDALLIWEKNTVYRNLENLKNGVIVVGDFLDTYENLPIKTHLGYQFFNDYCQDHQAAVYKYSIFNHKILTQKVALSSKYRKIEKSFHTLARNILTKLRKKFHKKILRKLHFKI